MARLSRRSFGAVLAAAGPAAAALDAQQSPTPAAPGNFRRHLAPETPAFEGMLEFTRQNVAPRAEPFPMTQVRLLPNSIYHDVAGVESGLYGAARRRTGCFIRSAPMPACPSDRRSRSAGGSSRKTASDPANCAAISPATFSRRALNWPPTATETPRRRATTWSPRWPNASRRLGGKYLSAFPTTWWDRLEKGERVWAPFYTIHKIMAGMFDMYSLAGNQQALQVLEGMAAWADEWTAPKTEEHMQQILTIEFGGIAETLYSLAAATNNDRWATVGDRFQKRSFLNPLAARRDELRGLHVNTHIPQVIAAARRYEISGDMRFHDVADYFFYEVSTARSYVTGGTSNAEAWLAPPRRLAAELKLSVNTAECCCAYNMLKLARHLYSWNPRPARTSTTTSACCSITASAPSGRRSGIRSITSP